MRLGRHWAFREPGIIPEQHYLWLSSPAVVEEYSGRAIWRVELVQDALHVPVDGVDAQPEPQSDPLVGVSLGCKAEDFFFAGREHSLRVVQRPFLLAVRRGRFQVAGYGDASTRCQAWFDRGRQRAPSSSARSRTVGAWTDFFARTTPLTPSP